MRALPARERECPAALSIYTRARALLDRNLKEEAKKAYTFRLRQPKMSVETIITNLLFGATQHKSD